VGHIRLVPNCMIVETVQSRKAETQQTCDRALVRGAKLCAIVVFALFTTLGMISDGFAAPIIGSASTIVRDVHGMLASKWRTVIIDDSVHQDEVIRTGDSSAARLIFADRTDFMVGAKSEVTLDKFIYDPGSNSGQLLIRATKGLMKFRTGRMASRSYKLITPVATIGVRGTEFVVRVAEDGTTTVQVLSGEVIVVDNKGKTVSETSA
jgi:hypothetical protein